MQEYITIMLRQAKQSFPDLGAAFTPSFVKGFFSNQLDIDLTAKQVSQIYHNSIQQLIKG